LKVTVCAGISITQDVPASEDRQDPTLIRPIKAKSKIDPADEGKIQD